MICYTNELGERFSPYQDWDGKPIKKSPMDSRYSYDPYVTYKKTDEYQHTVYSDRLSQWEGKKHDDLCEKHFNNKSQYWDGRSSSEVESFLRDYYDNQKLELIGIMQGCNVSSGYPYWIFMFND